MICVIISEYVLTHSNLPTEMPPTGFSLSLQWVDDSGETTNLSLNLKYSPTANSEVIRYTTDELGRPRADGTAKLEVSDCLFNCVFAVVWSC